MSTDKKLVASCSFGKDSLAAIITAEEHGHHIDEAIYCRIMFDDKISAELPEHDNAPTVPELPQKETAEEIPEPEPENNPPENEVLPATENATKETAINNGDINTGDKTPAINGSPPETFDAMEQLRQLAKERKTLADLHPESARFSNDVIAIEYAVSVLEAVGL